ncbi:MAG: phage protease [Sulfurimicrobium sp.]|nr:phage protease [Sulfurimicrobium sp.]
MANKTLQASGSASLTASHAIALPSGPAPEWVHLIPAGEFSGRDGRGPYKNNPQSVLDSFSAWGMPLAIDYEHQGLNAAENGQPAPASAWINELEARDGSIWGRVEWTGKAAAMIAAGEYKYLSPVFEHTKTGAIVRLTGCGLTNNPNLYLTAIARRSAHNQEDRMDELLERIIYMLNLPLTSTPEEIQAHLQRLIDGMKTADTTVAQMRKDLGLAGDAALETVATSMQARIKATEPDLGKYVPRAEFERVSHALSGMQTERDAEMTDRLVNVAMSKGKVSPGMEDWARSYCSRDRAGFEKYVESVPAIVSAHATLPGKPPKPGEENPLLKNAKARGKKV